MHTYSQTPSSRLQIISKDPRNFVQFSHGHLSLFHKMVDSLVPAALPFGRHLDAYHFLEISFFPQTSYSVHCFQDGLAVPILGQILSQWCCWGICGYNSLIIHCEFSVQSPPYPHDTITKTKRLAGSVHCIWTPGLAVHTKCKQELNIDCNNVSSCGNHKAESPILVHASLRTAKRWLYLICPPENQILHTSSEKPTSKHTLHLQCKHTIDTKIHIPQYTLSHIR